MRRFKRVFAKIRSSEIKWIETGENKFIYYDPYAADIYSLGVSILEIMGFRKQAFVEKAKDSENVYIY